MICRCSAAAWRAMRWAFSCASRRAVVRCSKPEKTANPSAGSTAIKTSSNSRTRSRAKNRRTNEDAP